jgi:excinuclease ABC subunit A
MIGVINFWSEKAKSKLYPKLKKIFQSKKYEKIIWSKLPKSFQNEILYGNKDFEGLINIMDNIYDGTSSWWRQWELEKFRNSKICKECNGKRLNEKALVLKVNDLNISDFTSLSINDSLKLD